MFPAGGGASTKALRNPERWRNREEAIGVTRGRKEEVVGADVGINRDANYDRALSASLGTGLNSEGSGEPLQGAGQDGDLL